MPAFHLIIRCNNCGKEYREDFNKGDEVTSGWDGCRVYDARCTHNMSCPYCRRLECDTCLSHNLSVIERHPTSFPEVG